MNFVHSSSCVTSETIGKNTRIWQYVVILKGAVIGDDCNICSHVFIESDVVVGNRVTIKSGVQLWDGLRIHDDVFIGPNATFANDLYPRSKFIPEVYHETYIHHGVSIGANGTILPGISIGKNSIIGAGSVVTSDVPANSIYVGNPAKFLREII